MENYHVQNNIGANNKNEIIPMGLPNFIFLLYAYTIKTKIVPYYMN